MGQKTAGLRVLVINDSFRVLAEKAMPIDEVKAWFEDTEELEAQEVRLHGLYDVAEAHRPLDRQRPQTFADVIESLDFERADLPMML